MKVYYDADAALNLITGKKIAVIGAGVAGLAAARDLALWGHAVTVYEKHWSPGGMLNQGIPEFRLPRDLIEKEIKQITPEGSIASEKLIIASASRIIASKSPRYGGG